MKWVRYLICAIIAFLFIFFDAILFTDIEKEVTQNHHEMIVFGAELLSFFIFGLLLGLEHLISEIKKPSGRWTFNVPRFILLGIPSLIFGLSMFIYYAMDAEIYFPEFVKNTSLFSDLSCLLFGYILTSNFEKVSKVKKLF